MFLRHEIWPPVSRAPVKSERADNDLTAEGRRLVPSQSPHGLACSAINVDHYRRQIREAAFTNAW
ncbi:MAG: hypothetical protein C3F11_15175 [Methylocystaceae bacterium]|nr:MAG: hypothetical protein C3F11_15175 [Methylocystaceae bacterium]